MFSIICKKTSFFFKKATTSSGGFHLLISWSYNFSQHKNALVCNCLGNDLTPLTRRHSESQKGKIRSAHMATWSPLKDETPNFDSSEVQFYTHTGALCTGFLPTRIFKVIKVRRNFHILTTSCSPPAVGTQITMYSRTFPSGGSQRTFKVLVVGSVTCRFLTKPSGSEQKYSQNRKSVSAWIWVTYL